MSTTTSESSAADTAERARRMAPPLLNRTNALLDELEWSRAEVQRLHAIDARRAQCARESRTAWIDAHVEDVIRTKQPALKDKPRCKWTSIVMRYYARKGKDAPDIETVRRVVYDFKGF